MAKVNPETDDVSGSEGHGSSFNLDGLTGKDGEYQMVVKF